MKGFLIIVFFLIIHSVGFTNHSTISSDNPIKIGFLIQDKSSTAAIHGAELAIQHANLKGGYKGRPFQLVVRSMEGPWGTGSKQAVDLIFNENVAALIGSHDGRNAHLVEQASAKAHVVFLSAWASDATLSQAFVPWYFSCVPNDLQQGDKLIQEIFIKRKMSLLGVVTEDGYDAIQATKSFIKQIKANGFREPLQFTYKASDKDFSSMVNEIRKVKLNGLVFFGQPESIVKIVQTIHKLKMQLPLFGSLSTLDERQMSYERMVAYEDMYLISPNHWMSPESKSFRSEYSKIYGNMPGANAAYAFDAINVIILAIQKAGTDFDALRKSMAATKYKGVTGIVQFDSKGNRMGSCDIIVIKNGVPRL